MSLNRETLRRLILEEIERISEMEEFAGAKSGKAFMKEGEKIINAGKKIYEIANGQTGTARKTIAEIGKFVHKMGEGIANINDLSEGGTPERLPSIQEFKQMINAIKKLER